MRSKCQHKNVHITEYFQRFVFHSIRNGVIKTEWNEDIKSEITEVYVLCDDCNLAKMYNSRQFPQWLQDRMQAIHENEYKTIEVKSYEGIRGTT